MVLIISTHGATGTGVCTDKFISRSFIEISESANANGSSTSVKINGMKGFGTKDESMGEKNAGKSQRDVGDLDTAKSESQGDGDLLTVIVGTGLNNTGEEETCPVGKFAQDPESPSLAFRDFRGVVISSSTRHSCSLPALMQVSQGWFASHL